MKEYDKGIEKIIKIEQSLEGSLLKAIQEYSGLLFAFTRAQS